MMFDELVHLILKYPDTTIKDAILESLSNNGKSTFNKLLEKAGEFRHKNYNRHSKKYEIARDAFNAHLKDLVRQNLVSTYDHGRGKPVEYDLTYKGKQQIRLKISGSKPEQGENFDVHIKTMKRENMFLLSLFVLRDEQEMYECAALGKKLGLMNVDVSRGIQTACDRRYALEHMGFTAKEIEEAFSLLESEGLISSIKIDNDQAHRLPYKIANESLYYLLREYLGLASYVRMKLLLIWYKILKPTREEAGWFEFFFTRKDYYTMFGVARDERKQIAKNTKRKQRFEDVREELIAVEERISSFIARIKETHTDTIMTHVFPADELVEKVYPKALQKSPFAN